MKFLQKIRKIKVSLDPMRLVAGPVLRHPKLSLAGFLLVVAVLSLGIPRVRFENRFEGDLPENDPIRQTNRRFEEVFGDRDLLMVAVVNDAGIYNERTLSKLVGMTRELEGIDGVVAGSVKSLCTVKNIANADWGLDIAPFFESPPEGADDVSAVREAVEENFMARGRLVSSDGTATVLKADLDPDHNVEAVYKQARAIAQKYEGPERIYLTGDTVVDYEVTSSMRKDVAVLFPLSLLLAVGILLIAFRRWVSVAVPSAAVVATTAASLGLMGLIGMPITVVGTILPVVIVAIVSAYGIHMVNVFNLESESGGTQQQILERTLASVGGPVVISALTSAIGFGSLVIFKIRSIHDFGLLLAVAIFFGLCSSLIFIPSALALFPAKGAKVRRATTASVGDRLVLRCFRFVERRYVAFLGITAIALLLAMAASFRLKVGLEPAKFFPEGHPTRQSLDVFDEKLGGSTYFNMMIDVDETDGITDPEMLGRMDEFQKFAASQEHVGYAASFVDVVQRLHNVLADEETTGKLPTERNQVAQYLLLYDMSGDPTDFDEIVDYDYRRAKMVVMITTYDDAEHLGLYRALKGKAAELFGDRASVAFGGRAMILLAQDRYIVVGKLINIVCSLFIVLVVCMLYFRSLSGGLLSILPLAISTVLTFGVMGFFGIRLNVATAMTSGVAVGVGVDFAVHYIHRFRHEYLRTGDEDEAVRHALSTTGRGIIFNAVSVSCGFLIFLGSRFQALRDFGWIIALTMLTCAVVTLFMLPVLIRMLRPYFIYGEEPEYVSRVLLLPTRRIPVLNLRLESLAHVRLGPGLKKLAQYF